MVSSDSESVHQRNWYIEVYHSQALKEVKTTLVGSIQGSKGRHRQRKRGRTWVGHVPLSRSMDGVLGFSG